MSSFIKVEFLVSEGDVSSQRKTNGLYSHSDVALLIMRLEAEKMYWLALTEDPDIDIDLGEEE